MRAVNHHQKVFQKTRFYEAGHMLIYQTQQLYLNHLQNGVYQKML